MNFLSVCSGIEAASVAWGPLGWKAIGFSEIESFPSALLKHHYPDVPNYGDMTALAGRISSGEIEAPDLLCGGTPCQAFSVAGLRKSLDDIRGNLTLTFCEIANAIDDVRCTRKLAPAIIFWENVPGVLNTKDNAFGCFLGELAGESCELQPPRGKWKNAGVVLGPQRAVAWRVLDAQHFGVAQRRRRVFVVASARDGFNPAKVLFEFEGVRRDTAPSREARKVAPTIPSRSTAGGGLGTDFDCDGGVIAHAFKVRGGVEREDGSRGSQNIGKQAGKGYLGSDELAFTVASSPDQWLFQRQSTNLVAQTYSTPAIGHIVQDDVASTITKNTGAGGETQNPAYVAQPIGFNTRQDPDAWQGRTGPVDTHYGTQGVAQPIAIQDVRGVEKAQNGKGWNADGTAYTVDTHATQGVAQPVTQWGEVAGSLTARHDSSPCADRGMNIVAQPVGVDIDNTNITGDCSGNILAGAQMRSNKGMGVMQPVAMVNMQGSKSNAVAQADGPSYTLNAMHGHDVHAIAQPTMQVRRLTPTECERLQGFPDGWTDIPWRGKPNAPDGPRYKALGNSWAVPVVAWIGRRIQSKLGES